jgi:hypothetical protein
VPGPAVEELRADPVELAAPVAFAATPVGPAEQGAEMPAAHVASGAFTKRVNAQRHKVTNRDYDNDNYQHPELLDR